MAVLPAPLPARFPRAILLSLLALLLAAGMALAAPYAAVVMDARTGQILKAENADTRLHPASLTKMMTLYVTFEAIRNGEITLDTLVTVSAKAANEPPSKLGLKAGQKIKLRYLIRAAAIKSANDAATAIGEAVGGSEAAFARRMNRTAVALGMTRTTFKNANGLTEAGHLSTARDMTVLGRRLFYDHPSYYNLFSRRSSDAGGKTVVNTNSRFLSSYQGADGIKTGYTVAAGFNLVGSAQRGNVRIIATVFGGTSTAQRNAKVAELLDYGFRNAPSNVREKKPSAPVYADVEDAPQVAAARPDAESIAAGKTIRVVGAVTRSLRPRWRPGPAIPEPAPDLLLAMQSEIMDTLAAVQQEVEAEAPSDLAPVLVAKAPPRPDRAGPAPEPEVEVEVEVAKADILDHATIVPPPRPALPATEAPVPEPPPVALAELSPALQEPTVGADTLAVVMPAEDPSEEPEDAYLTAEADEIDEEPLLMASALPTATSALPDSLLSAKALAVEPETFEASGEPVVVTRLSTSGGRNWGINVGTYNSQYEAEKVLLRTALMEIGTLDEALRKVAKTNRGFNANFLGMTSDLADLACARLIARGVACTRLEPTG